MKKFAVKIFLCMIIAVPINVLSVFADDSCIITTVPGDNAVGVPAKTTVTVSTNGKKIDFVMLSTMCNSAVTIIKGNAYVSELAFDELVDPYSYSFDLSGMSPLEEYIICVKVPVVPTEKIETKIFGFMVASEYNVLDSIEYEGYTWDVGADSGQSPALQDGRNEIWWQMYVDHTIVENGVMRMEAGVNQDGSYMQPGTVTAIGSGLNTKDIESIQMRVRLSRDANIKMYYTSNEQDYFSEGDTLGDKTLLSQRIPGDNEWHIVTLKPTSAAWTDSCDRILHTIWFQASGNDPPDTFEIDWIRYMGNGGVKDNGYGILKYGFEKPVLIREEDRVCARIPYFINYSPKNINLAYMAVSYKNGRLTNFSLRHIPVNAGSTVSDLTIRLESVSNDETIKVFIWNIENLRPINADEIYD